MELEQIPFTELQAFTSREVYLNQTFIVERLMQIGDITIDDIENYPEDKEIFAWWLVSGWLLEQLKAHNQPILETDYGNWWGRVTYGGLIADDTVIREIYLENYGDQ